MADSKTDINRITLTHRQGDGGKCPECDMAWPCDTLNQAIAERANAGNGNGGGMKLVPWRAMVFFADEAGQRADPAVFSCNNANDAAWKVKTELERRRKDQADRLGGPDAWCGEAEIVAPDRRVVRRCYLFGEDEPLQWHDEDPDGPRANVSDVEVER